MSDNRPDGIDSTDNYSLDDEDQLQPEDTLDDRGVEDVLDEGFSPADRPRYLEADGREETIEDRIRQEVPDPYSAYGAPDNESGLDTPRLGGNDPDSILAEDDFVGDDHAGSERAGRLVAPDQGTDEDVDSQEVATDIGIDGAGASAEEAAVHVLRGEDDDR